MKLAIVLLLLLPMYSLAQDLHTFPSDRESGWISFENPGGEKGKGGSSNKKAKGHPAEFMKPGETKTLCDIQGSATIHRIWMTVNERTPFMLRSLRLDMYWENETKPAVSVPLADFFGMGLGRMTAFQNVLFSNPEGRSFTSYLSMPFRRAARITLTNESAKPVLLFYDINFTRVKQQPQNMLYMHAFWSRNTNTQLGQDFDILPRINGKGRFIGCNLGIITDSVYATSWWGEGEVKMYVDGDTDLPTLVGTGTEDYIGTGWGQGAFTHMYQGCPVADEKNRQWTFYRYHITDPIYFNKDLRVSIQQMGGDDSEKVRQIAKAGGRLIPVTVALEQGWVNLLETNPAPKLEDANFPKGWTNFYRLDNYSATAYFYIDKPSSNLPPLASLKERTDGVLK